MHGLDYFLRYILKSKSAFYYYYCYYEYYYLLGELLELFNIYSNNSFFNFSLLAYYYFGGERELRNDLIKLPVNLGDESDYL